MELCRKALHFGSVLSQLKVCCVGYGTHGYGVDRLRAHLSEQDDRLPSSVAIETLAPVDDILFDDSGPWASSVVWKVATVKAIVWVNGCPRCKPPAFD